jgi:hypothetical protein
MVGMLLPRITSRFNSWSPVRTSKALSQIVLVPRKRLNHWHLKRLTGMSHLDLFLIHVFDPERNFKKNRPLAILGSLGGWGLETDIY